MGSLRLPGSYGSLARFRDVSRLVKVGDKTLVGAGGDIADYHAVKDLLDGLQYVVCVPSS